MAYHSTLKVQLEVLANVERSCDWFVPCGQFRHFASFFRPRKPYRSLEFACLSQEYARFRMCPAECEALFNFDSASSSLHFLFPSFTSMDLPNTTFENTTERRQLRDIKGNLVYRDKDDTRVMLSHIAEYTSWDTTKMLLTFPLMIWRMPSMLRHSMNESSWTAPDPTIIVPSGTRNPNYWPKYEDQPRPEPE